MKGAVLALLLGVAGLRAQNPCANTPAYTPCDLTFELNDAEAAAHPSPYLSVAMHAEFKSPTFHTYLMPAFWDGGRRLVIRFTPTEPGNWEYRVTSNVKRWEGQTGSFTAAASELPGFIVPRNVHHWAYADSNRPHLWMGDTCFTFGFMDEALFRQVVDARAAQKFTHIRGLILGSPADAAAMYSSPDQPNPAGFQRLDQRILYINRKGIIADLILAGANGQLASLFPNWQQRQRYIRYIVARYAPMNITWQGFRDFESYADGRPLLKEVGRLLKDLDPYHHPMTSGTLSTSAPLLDDGWQNFVSYHSADDQLGAIEHQLFAVPFVNLNFGVEDSGAGKSGPDAVDLDTFRHRLWNATMNGQYVTYANTGTYGGGSLPVDAKYLDSPGAKMMTAWFDFFSGTRHWELEPYFDVDGGRGLALEDVEYIIYVEKPGPVEVLVERHGYDVEWINPISGEHIREKNFKGEHYTGDPPDKTHDWVLHISREGHKEGMLRSYKFESRRIEMQVIEQNPAKVPFEIAQPAQDLSLSKPAEYAVKLTRATHATRSMMYLWTVEAAAEGQGFRVAGTGPQGRLHIPPSIARKFPAVLSLRLYGMNAVGKVYAADKALQLTQ
ncbi:MAG TPA: DUF5060 domain-containing protein [Bryobacteraceae bacterium]|nr:DUF5060 domain-containing protein [Bryobacteraceae bacterium]